MPAEREREQFLDEVLPGYLRGVKEGSAPSRQHLLEMHPELAEDLSDFFADQDHFKRMAAPLRGPMPQVGRFVLPCRNSRGVPLAHCGVSLVLWPWSWQFHAVPGVN